jgi:hypothetical protein
MDNKKVTVTVESMISLSHGRFKVKIKETNLGLIDMVHEGRNFITVKDHGRGRYVMREIENDNDKEWDALGEGMDG